MSSKGTFKRYVNSMVKVQLKYAPTTVEVQSGTDTFLCPLLWVELRMLKVCGCDFFFVGEYLKAY